MTSKYDLLAIDLDGTLLGPDGRVSDANRAAVARAREAGIEIVPATGRGLVESRDVFRAIEHEGHVVVAGGAMTVDVSTGATVSRRVMEPELVGASVDRIHAHGHAALVLKDAAEIDYEYLVVRGGADIDPVTKWWFDMTGVRARDVEALDQDERADLTIRVGCAAIGQEAGVLCEQLQAELGDRAVLHRFTTSAAPSILEAAGLPGATESASVQIVEVFDAGAGKWNAISERASALGIDPIRIAAIGDEINDVDMLKAAGLGIAMGNAVDAAREVSDVATERNDRDGVALAIDRILSGAW